MMNDFITEQRSKYCEESADGRFLCKCGAFLQEDDALSCKGCVEKSRVEREQAERKRLRQEWEAGLSKASARALKNVPDWEHLHKPDAFAKKVRHPHFVAIAEKWTPDQGCLLLLSPSGGGKTSTLARAVRRRLEILLAAALANPKDREAEQALREFSSLVWTTGMELMRALREHRLGTGCEPELFSDAVEASLLVIDELGPDGAQRAGDIFDLVDRRYVRKLPTLVTSGLTLEVFTERYGDAFRRRLTETGRGALIDGHPRRKDG